MDSRENSRPALERRWIDLCRRQQLQRRAAMKRAQGSKLDQLKNKIPEKTRSQLEWAFGKAFALIFQQGGAIIEKTYSSEKLAKKYIARDLAMTVDGDAAYFDGASGTSTARNMLITTLEGIGLGALGIGLPDIVLFVAVLLRSVYETALQYGFSYDKPADRLYILCMLETAMLSGWSWVDADAHLEAMGSFPEAIDSAPEALEIQLQRTAAAFATDLLVLKFIQGLPIVGIIGGAANPVYYHRINSYVQLKYQRRYVKNALESKKED